VPATGRRYESQKLLNRTIMAKVPRKSKKKETSAEQWAREAKENARKTAKIDPAALKYRYDEVTKIARELVLLPAEYPLKLVANIAARLLPDEDHRFAPAVRKRTATTL